MLANRKPQTADRTMKIHKTAIVSKKAKIAKDVKIGPYVIVEDDVKIGSGTTIGTSSYIYSGTSIGEDCRVFNNVTLGSEPQDLAYKEGKSFLNIGDRNVFREYVTAHRGTKEGSSTIIGNDNYFMALSHIAHNCHIHNNVVMCNNSLLAGYVEVESGAFISGGCAVHQFVRIGKLAMMGGAVRVSKDVPPFMMAREDDMINSYNVVGLKRANLSPEARRQIKEAYKILYLSGFNTTNALKKIEEQFKSEEIKHLIRFIRTSRRGICSGRRRLAQNS